MANVDIQIGKKDAAFFTANPTLVLENGQLIFNETTGDLFIGDGSTQLNALTAINGGGGGLVDSVNGLIGAVLLGLTKILEVDNDANGNKLINLSDPTNPQDADTLAARNAAIAAAVSGLSNIVPYVHANSTTISPPDGQYIYIGLPTVNATNSVNGTLTTLREVAIPVTGTIIGAIVSLRVSNGTSASNETSTLSLRNTTQSTLETISSVITYDGPTADTFKSFVVSGLNISVTAGDMCMSVIGNPNFATNPLLVSYYITYLIET